MPRKPNAEAEHGALLRQMQTLRLMFDKQIKELKAKEKDDPEYKIPEPWTIQYNSFVDRMNKVLETALKFDKEKRLRALQDDEIDKLIYDTIEHLNYVHGPTFERELREKIIEESCRVCFQGLLVDEDIEPDIADEPEGDIAA